MTCDLLRRALNFVPSLLPMMLFVHVTGYATQPSAIQEGANAALTKAAYGKEEGIFRKPSPVETVKQVSLDFERHSNLSMISVPATWKYVGKAVFEADVSGGKEYDARNGGIDAVTTGGLTWRITSRETRIVDTRTGRVARFPELTTDRLRAREIKFDKQTGQVWLFGQSIYRYEMSSRELMQISPLNLEFHSIRKMIDDSERYWFTDAEKIFSIDKDGRNLRQLLAGGAIKEAVINAASIGSEIWFATSSARLLRLSPGKLNHFQLAVSEPLQEGMPVEMIGENGKLWMLLTNINGDQYKLAFLSGEGSKLNVAGGKYFSLTREAGQLWAGSNASQFRIDTEKMTMTRFDLAVPGALQAAVKNNSFLFIGASYSYKDNCEIVERGVFDISKGWVQSTLKNADIFR